jgi:predicted CXXCH cytochrome family protein
VAWARERADLRGRGLLITLDERAGVSFVQDPQTRVPHRSAPRRSTRELDLCARCHSRRSLLHEDLVHGQPVGDDYRVALLDEDLYYPDGQVKGEVYEYGSFVQSRMFQAGVTCSDCHDPHRPELRAAADSLCLQCHDTTRYLSTQHHHHAASSVGARCVACHMPATTFMEVDARRDHSLRVPRPDLSVTLGVPNPCTGCHQQRGAAWAARTVVRWYGHPSGGLQQFATALAAATTGAPGAASLIAALLADGGQPAIARASSLERIARRPTQAAPSVLAAAEAALSDEDALVRRAATQALAQVEPRRRVALLAPRLDDPVRAVRIEAALALPAVPAEHLSAPAAAARDRAVAELIAAQTLGGDRPEGHLALALLHVAEQRFDRAESELRRALAIDPGFVPAAVNLADLYRATARDREAEPVLRAALGHAPGNATLLHALGLVMVRERRLREAIDWLGRAAAAGEAGPRYGYVYAVALHDAGRFEEALRQLDGVLRRWPYDRDALTAEVTYLSERGETAKVRAYAARLAALDPP